jgi:hypothetical protein
MTIPTVKKVDVKPITPQKNILFAFICVMHHGCANVASAGCAGAAHLRSFAFSVSFPFSKSKAQPCNH